jgi:pimeloyl-ACP methyl ester carboxylesterase
MAIVIPFRRPTASRTKTVPNTDITVPRTRGVLTSVHAADGTRLHVEVYGQGPAMLLFNGFACSRHYWPLWVDHFAKTHTVILWDYRGYGLSHVPKDVRSVTLAQFAADGLAVLDGLSISEATVVGHSMGVAVILEAWRQAPHRVNALITLCGTSGKPQAILKPRFAGDLFVKGVGRVVHSLPGLFGRVKARVVQREILIRLSYALAVNPKLCDRRYLEALFRHIATLNPEVMIQSYNDFIRFSAEEILAQCTAPIFVVSGTLDTLAPPEVCNRMKLRAANADTLVVPEGSHLAFLEAPELVHRSVERFLDRWLVGKQSATAKKPA